MSGGMPMTLMHEHMQKMRAQMQEIHRNDDPDKRDELLQAHMQDMQETMKMMMQHMHGGKPITGQGGMKGPGDGPGGMMTGDPQGMMQMMEQRRDMMQKMMDQMMQNQAAMEETRMMRDRHHGYRQTQRRHRSCGTLLHPPGPVTPET
jgi:hypothetical protein